MSSGIYGQDVPGWPFMFLFGELYRAGYDVNELARFCGFSEDVSRRLIFGEAPVIRRKTAYKALRAITLLPAERWFDALGLEDAQRYRNGAWVETG